MEFLSDVLNRGLNGLFLLNELKGKLGELRFAFDFVVCVWGGGGGGGVGGGGMQFLCFIGYLVLSYYWVHVYDFFLFLSET